MSRYFSYVLQLISLVNKTLNVRVDACTKFETPYGMELRWRLLGDMDFHIHLKDNIKVCIIVVVSSSSSKDCVYTGNNPVKFVNTTKILVISGNILLPQHSCKNVIPLPWRGDI